MASSHTILPGSMEVYLSLFSLRENTKALLLLNPCEKAEFEAAGDLYHLQSVWGGCERKRHLKAVFGIKHQLWSILAIVQHSLDFANKRRSHSFLKIIYWSV